MNQKGCGDSPEKLYCTQTKKGENTTSSRFLFFNTVYLSLLVSERYICITHMNELQLTFYCSIDYTFLHGVELTVRSVLNAWSVDIEGWRRSLRTQLRAEKIITQQAETLCLGNIAKSVADLSWPYGATTIGLHAWKKPRAVCKAGRSLRHGYYCSSRLWDCHVHTFVIFEENNTK